MRYLPPTNDTLIPFGNRMLVLLDCLLDIAVFHISASCYCVLLFSRAAHLSPSWFLLVELRNVVDLDGGT